MGRGTRAFWGIVLILGSASIYFGANAESVRRAAHDAHATVESGDVVSVTKVVDGDTVVVARSDGVPVTVRLLGIKSFDATSTKDPTAAHGQRAIDALTKMTAGRPARVLVGPTPRDKDGRTIATLYLDDHDVALDLVRDGRVLVFTAFPFPMVGEYLHEQETARAAKKGLWADPVAADRARFLAAQWGAGKP